MASNHPAFEMKKIDALINKITKNRCEQFTMAFLEQTASGYALTCHITRGVGNGTRQLHTTHDTEAAALEAAGEVAQAHPNRRRNCLVFVGEEALLND